MAVPLKELRKDELFNGKEDKLVFRKQMWGCGKGI